MGIQQNIGKEGEELAQTFLERKGYSILATNFRYGQSEIDMIARSPDGWLVFVEVKARKDSTFGYPEDFVSRNQMGAIRRAAEGYLQRNGWEKKFRFDIIAILLTQPPQLEHLEDAF